MAMEIPYAPKSVSDLEIAFPGEIRHMMPAKDDIPEEFWEDRGDARPWLKFQRDWFFSGLPKATKWLAREGIDPTVAIRHLRFIQGSWDPPHEYKEAAVAYLASLWFEKPPAGGAS